MNTRKGLLLLSLFFCCLPGAMFAQVVAIERGHEANKGTMNFTAVANYLLAHPEPLIQQEKKNRTFDQPHNRPVDPAVLAAKATTRIPSSLIPAGPRIPLPMSPAPTDTFQAVLDNSTTIPPDTHGAVDGTYCVTAVNPNVRIQTRSGGSVSVVSLNSFFTSVNSANGVFDPRVHYDPFSNRWILVAVSGANNVSDSTSILIGVSQTSSPTGSWWLYRIRAYTAGGYWLDYPNVGINGKWVTVTGNLFVNSPGSGYGGAKVFVFNKSSLMSGAGAPFTAFTMSTSDFTLCPAFNYDASNANMFAVETWNGTVGAMKLWKITGAVGSEALTSVGFIISPNDWHWGVNAFSGPTGVDFAPQSGTSNKVQTNDDRVNQMILMNGKLWFSHTVFMPYSSSADPTRSSVQWWQTDTAISGGLVPTVQVGLIDDNTNTNFYAFPSIAVNTQNDALIGFSRFSATTFPSAAYAMRVHTDVTDSTRPVVVYRNGLANYYKTYSGTKNRWGDYSGTCLDPTNSLDFWTIQEASSYSNLWDTRWAHVLAPCTTPGSITGTATVCVGSTTTLANSVSGGTWSSATTSVATVNSTSGVVTGVASGTSTITYSMGGTCFVTKVVTVNALPGTISGSATVCVGSTTTFSSSPTGGVWTSSASGTASVNSTSGVVTGVAGGTATITYTLSTGCFATKAVTVNTAPSAISGTLSVCTGSTTTLSSSPTGGVWTSSASGTASVNSTSGVVTGAAAGTATITYTLSSGCFVTAVVTVNTTPGAISGTATVCVGSTTTLSSSPTGGVWTSSASGTASVNSTSGVVSGVAAGTATITYTLAGGCFATRVVTVNTQPGAITGVFSICTGSSSTLSSSPTGGVWTSSNTSIATVGSSTGTVNGIVNGTATITYTLAGGCMVTQMVTVHPMPTAITGTAIVCSGLTTTLSSTPTGGTWTSSATGTASVNSTSGVVTGGTAGTATITYTLSGGCFATRVVTVNTTPSAITGTFAICVGTSTTLSSSPTGGTWSSSTPGFATVGSVSGTVTGVAGGVATITYTLSTGCFATQSFTVISTPSSITGTALVCTGQTTTLSSTPTGGVWTSSATGTASVNSTSGVVSGVAVGTATITYTLSGGCFTTRVVTVNTTPSAITGTFAICDGTSTTLSCSPTGGTWSSSNPSIATVGSASGVVSGVVSGVNTITYTLSSGCFATQSFTVTSTPSSITGTAIVCTGLTTTLSSTPAGGTWTSSASGTASVNSTSGVVTGGTAGTATITYTLSGGCFTTRVVTVSSTTPAAITGTFSVCVGLTTTLSSATAGGTWSSSNVTQATVVAGTGLVTGVAAGTPIITYTLPSGCFATQTITVVAAPAAIFGASAVCAGATTTLSSSPTGGTWSSSASGTASVNSTSGVVTGGSTGTATITYTLPAGCFVTKSITVTAAPGAITGSLAVCTGATTALSSSPTGGTWTSGATGTATVNSTTGVVSGVAAGTANITYSLGTGCESVATVTVNASPTAITGTAAVCIGSTTTLSSTPTGGTWTSSASGTATVNSTSGVVTGVGAGTATITYTLAGGCFSTRVVTVNAAPGAITGSLAVCTGATTALSCSPTGGTWTSGATGTATVNSTTGVVSGVASGTANITYSLGTGCESVATVTVNASPTAITGTAAVCIGSTTTLSSSPTGGTWTSSASGTASVNSTSGVVTGVGAGTATITYMLTGGCFTTRVITVNGLPTITLGTNPSVIIGTTSANLPYSATSGSPATYSIVYSSAALTAGFANVTAASLPATPIVLAVPGSAPSAVYTGTLTVTSATCTSIGYPFSVTITSGINTPPVFTGGSPQTFLACSFPTLNSINALLDISDPDVGNVLTWTVVSPPSHGVVFSGSSAISSGSTVTPLGFNYRGAYGYLGADAFTIQVSDGAGGFATTTVNVTVNPVPAPVALTGGGGYCAGGAGVHVGIAGSAIGVNYQLYRGGVPVGSPVAGIGAGFSFGLQTVAGNYTVTASNATAPCTLFLPGSVNVIVYSLPTDFTVTGGGTYCPGGTGITIGLSGSQTGVTYRLYRGATPVGASISGTGAAISFGLQTVAGTYTVIATMSGFTACTATMTGSAVVALYSLPTAYTITGGGSYCPAGTGAAIGLSGSDVGVNYQLYLGAAAVGSPVAGTGSALSFGLVTGIGTYTVKGTSTVTGCMGNMSGSVAVSLSTLPYAFTVTGGGSFCSGGTGVNVVLGGSVTGVNYQLYNGVTPIGSPVAGTGTTINFGPQTTAGIYTVVGTNATTGCSKTMLGSALVNVIALPAVFTVTGGGSFCSGSTGVSIGLSGSATGVTYQLYRGGVSVGSPLTGSGSTINFGLFTVAGTYTVIARAVGTACTSNMSGSAVITVNALPTAYTVTGGGGYCTGGTGVNVLLSNSAAGVNYQLYLGATPIGTPVAGTGSALNFGLQTTAGTYTVVATDATTGCTRTMTGSAVVTVNPLPTVFTVTGGGNFCTGGTGMAIGLSGSQSGVNYQLYRAASAVGGPVAGSGAAIGFGVHSTAGTYTVVATRTATGCNSNMSGSATISVNPLPTVYTVTGGGGLCSGGTGAVVGLSGSDAGINYQLYRGTTAVGSPVAGTGSSISFGAQTVAGTYTVRATNATTSCATTMSGSATITVGTLPTVVSVTGGGAYCSGGVGVNVGLSASVVGTNYQLYLGGTPVGSPVAGIGAGFNFGLQTAAGIYTVIATFASSSCSNTMSGSATVIVSALPTVYTVTGGGSYCTGGSGVSIGLSGSAPGITYKLVRSGTPIISVTGTGTALSFGSYTTVGTYTVLAIAAGTGCSSTMSGSAVVTVNPVPVISGSIYTLLPTGSITLSASISGGTWTSSNTAVATVGSSTGIVAGASLGSTVITYTLPTGCYDVQVVSVTPTGYRPEADDEGKPTEILSAVAKISVLPNPNKGIFTVKGSLGVREDADYQMEVFDILGRVVYTVNATAYDGQIEKIVELGAAARGNYVLRIYSGGEYLVYRIVVDQ